MEEKNPKTTTEDVMPEQPPEDLPQWKKVHRLPIQEQMVDVLKKTKEATECEIARLRAKLDRISRGI
jgi:hypothetical protein